MKVHQGKVQDVADENARARSPPWIPSQPQRTTCSSRRAPQKVGCQSAAKERCPGSAPLGSTSHAHVAAEQTQQQPASVGLQSTQGRKLTGSSATKLGFEQLKGALRIISLSCLCPCGFLWQLPLTLYNFTYLYLLSLWHREGHDQRWMGHFDML